MPLVRLLGQRFGTPVDHADGQRGCLCLRGPARLMPPRPRLWEGSRAEEWLETRQLDGAAKQEVVSNPIVDRRAVMGAYCTLVYIRRHAARMGEIMEVRRPYPYHHVAVFGDNEELACIPHRGCWLEIVAAPETSHGEVNLLLPGQVIRYTRSFFFGDRLEVPSGRKVGLEQLVGFKLQLARPTTAAPPEEETVAKSVPAGKPDGVTVAG
jgi:hypothetical protein